MALRCVLEKVGRLSYKNHLNLTKRCFFGGISIKNHHQNLIRSFCRYSSSSSRERLAEIIDCMPKEVKDWFHLENPVYRKAFESNCAGGTFPFCGPMDDPHLLEAARAAVEQHNKQQNSNLEFVRVVGASTRVVSGLIWDITFEATDAGAKNTYQAEVWQTISDGWKLLLFKLRAPQCPSSHPDVMPALKGPKLSFLEVASLPRLDLKEEVERVTTSRGDVLMVNYHSTIVRESGLKSCLVGRFDRDVGSLERMEKCATKTLKISCGVKVSSLADGLLLFRFPSEKEAQKVLRWGKKTWGDAQFRHPQSIHRHRSVRTRHPSLMALRCVLEKVGRLGYKNHLNLTKRCFFGGISIKNHHQNLIRSFCRYSSSSSRERLAEIIDCMPKEVKDWFHLENPVYRKAFESNCAGGTFPFCGPMDDPHLLEAARATVEQHYKQQNSNLEFVRVVGASTRVVSGLIWDITFEATDAGAKNTYQAEVWQTISDGWKLLLFKLRAPQRPSSHPAVMPGDL